MPACLTDIMKHELPRMIGTGLSTPVCSPMYQSVDQNLMKYANIAMTSLYDQSGEKAIRETTGYVHKTVINFSTDMKIDTFSSTR